MAVLPSELCLRSFTAAAIRFHPEMLISSSSAKKGSTTCSSPISSSIFHRFATTLVLSNYSPEGEAFIYAFPLRACPLKASGPY